MSISPIQIDENFVIQTAKSLHLRPNHLVFDWCLIGFCAECVIRSLRFLNPLNSKIC